MATFGGKSPTFRHTPGAIWKLHCAVAPLDVLLGFVALPPVNWMTKYCNWVIGLISKRKICRKAPCLVIKTMVSCRYSLQPIHCKLDHDTFSSCQESKHWNEPIFTSGFSWFQSSSFQFRPENRSYAPSLDLGFHLGELSLPAWL